MPGRTFDLPADCNTEFTSWLDRYLPFEQDAANVFFLLVSSRYEHASVILTSNLPFSGWGGAFGDQAVAAPPIDRIVHHADVLTVEGASGRLRKHGIDTLPGIRTTTSATDNWSPYPKINCSLFDPVANAQFSSVVDSRRVLMRAAVLAVGAEGAKLAGR